MPGRFQGCRVTLPAPQLTSPPVCVTTPGVQVITSSNGEQHETSHLFSQIPVSNLQYKDIHSEDDERELAACVAPSDASLG